MYQGGQEARFYGVNGAVLGVLYISSIYTALWQDHLRGEQSLNLLVLSTYSVLAYRYFSNHNPLRRFV